MNAKNSRVVALLSAILVAAVLRLVPHPPNFTPIGAMALFSGAYLGRRGLAFVAPLGAMAAERRNARFLFRSLDHVPRRRADRGHRLAVPFAHFDSERWRSRYCKLGDVFRRKATSALGRSAECIHTPSQDYRLATSQRSRFSRTRSPATCSTRRCSSAASALPSC